MVGRTASGTLIETGSQQPVNLVETESAFIFPVEEIDPVQRADPQISFRIAQYGGDAHIGQTASGRIIDKTALIDTVSRFQPVYTVAQTSEIQSMVGSLQHTGNLLSDLRFRTVQLIPVIDALIPALGIFQVNHPQSVSAYPQSGTGIYKDGIHVMKHFTRTDEITEQTDSLGFQTQCMYVIVAAKP